MKEETVEIKKLNEKATIPTYGSIDAAGADLNYHTFEIGAGAYEKYGSLIPEETFKAIEKYKIALKGPVTTPIGKGFRSVNVQLRLKYNLYVNLRPAYSFEGISNTPPLV